MSLVLWVMVYTALRALVWVLSQRFAAHRAVKVLLFPGVLASIAVRAFTTGLAQGQVKEMNPPWSDGPPVVSGSPRAAVLGAVLFGLLPPIAAAALPLASTSALGFPPGIRFELPAQDFSEEGLANTLGTAKELALATVEAARTADWSDWRLSLIVWLSISFEVYLAPPPAEWMPLGAMLGAAWAGLGVIRWLGLQPAFLSRAWFIELFYGDPVWECMARLLANALLVVALSLVLGAIAWALARRAAAAEA